jgi:hypothetical protein
MDTASAMMTALQEQMGLDSKGARAGSTSCIPKKDLEGVREATKKTIKARISRVRLRTGRSCSLPSSPKRCERQLPTAGSSLIWFSRAWRREPAGPGPALLVDPPHQLPRRLRRQMFPG